jgi:ssDNA-binding Zn-finger/Zn-ribbon topoisomerase 1
MGKKKYRITTSCPQCGCGGEAEMSEEELKKIWRCSQYPSGMS